MTFSKYKKINVFNYINIQLGELLLYGQNCRDLLPITDKSEIYGLFSVRIYFKALPRGLGYIRLGYVLLCYARLGYPILC